ncbi:MAG: hypothetical protein ACFB5Z_03925 [Elainellaceae cyanobacterium]
MASKTAPPQSAPSIAAQCPKCGKSSIVSRPDNAYSCLSCDFHRDFSKDKKKGKDKGSSGGPLAILLVIVTLILLL